LRRLRIKCPFAAVVTVTDRPRARLTAGERPQGSTSRYGPRGGVLAAGACLKLPSAFDDLKSLKYLSMYMTALLPMGKLFAV
jgi:hypothetical protein